MNSISAFVAHSFDEDDAQLVRTFLDYLTTVANIHPGFRWLHAERAEPKYVAEKVLTLLDEANLLIAICTKKELVVPESALTRSWFSTKRISLASESLSWKTSDWIIQEIGLAVGRKMNVILLVESGLKTPGDLQGSLEHIEFERNAPEKSFDKILQMLTALSGHSPAKAGVADIDTGIASPEARDNETRTVSAGPVEKPQQEWDFSDYRQAMLEAILFEKHTEVTALEQDFSKSHFSKSEENVATWRALKEFIQLALGRGGNLKALVELSEKNPQNSLVIEYLASVYRSLEEHSKAASQFERAATVATETADELRLLGTAAVEYQNDGAPELAQAIMEKLRRIASNDLAIEGAYLRAEKEYAECIGEDSLQIATMERMLELDPTDNYLRFSLAFKYSEMDIYVLAAWHYQRIPVDARSALASNNLGAAYNHLDLPGLAVGNYRKAEKENETLAMSNLAFKFIDAGFFDEAKALCEYAAKIENYHKNIDSVKTRLTEAIEDEEARRKAKFEEGKKEADFLRNMGRSLSLSTNIDINGEWQGPSCTLTVVVNGSQFVAKGIYEVAASPLFKNMGLAADATITEIQYVGKICQGAIVCTVSRQEKKPSVTASLLGIGEPKATVLMSIQPGFSEIRVLERKSAASPEMYVFRRPKRLTS